MGERVGAMMGHNAKKTNMPIEESCAIQQGYKGVQIEVLQI